MRPRELTQIAVFFVPKKHKDKIMKELKLVTKEIKCDADGKGWVTVSGLARLAGVSQPSVSEWHINLTHRQKDDFTLESIGLPIGKNEIYPLKRKTPPFRAGI